MRAVTWSEDFDLNTEINSLYQDFAERDFEVPVETLVKVLAVVAGKSPTAASMLELRGTAAPALHEAVHKVRTIVEQAKVFLEERFAIHSYEYLPYEGELLVLVRFIQMGGNQDLIKTKRVEQWLWATSFNEELRGKPDHYVARILDRLEQLVSGNLHALRSRLTITSDDLLERRFIRGKALSAAFACMFAKHEARSLITGDVIAPELYMKEFATKNFEGLLETSVLANIFSREFPSKKIFANTFLFSEDDLLAAKGLSGTELIVSCLARHGDQASEILKSQFVVPGSLHFLREGDFGSFLATRASTIVKAAEQLVGQEP